MKYKTILLFGAPGAGKGTQGKILGTIPHFFHCACGDVFRSLSASNPLAKIFIEYTGRGQLVPDEPTVKLWRNFIKNSEHSGRFHPKEDVLVLDGIPRNLHQAEMLDGVLRRLQGCECTSMPVVRKGQVLGIVTLENSGELIMVQDALRASQKGSAEGARVDAASTHP